ncbi:reverse transcriptase [Elysia marginata]|uniref:Reverse transcriptase n=1 Tax=Elysia marginata TaxID=1093978 RepID=A0AAV4FI20_9GAST|nr:reverse transcriptase [Elysia marginata]
MGEDQCASQIAEKKKELENLRAQIMKGLIIRSKARWINEEEKVSRYFCNLENRHYTPKRINSIINVKGEEIEDNELITNEVKQYYENLYNSQKGKTEDIDLNLELLANTPKLTDKKQSRSKGLYLWRKQPMHLNTRRITKALALTVSPWSFTSSFDGLRTLHGAITEA